MSASLRGHQGQVKFFKNGKEVLLAAITKVDANQDSTFSRAHYVGQRIPEGDQAIDGWSGSVDMEVKDSALDDMIDELVTDNQNGIGVADYTMVISENYGDGQTSSHVYYDLQLKMSKTMAGLNDKMTKKLDFQASGRLAL